MLSLDLYIHAAAVIAPDARPDEPVLKLHAPEPDYSGIIAPMQLRRMSKAVRMGIGAARACLGAAGLAGPDAIAVGTALGCVADTEVFLRKMTEQGEQLLTPTAFIQSTHNTVAGQIALATGCHGYNTTVVQHGHSFEGAVVSAALYLAEHPDDAILTGGVDELTETAFALMQRIGIYTKIPFLPEDVADERQRGAIGGEGAGFFLLRKTAEGAVARISGLYTFSAGSAEAAWRLTDRCIAAKGGIQEDDFVISGASGDAFSHDAYRHHGSHSYCFKQRSGEWGTAIAVALARLAAAWPEGRKRAWIINNYGRDWAVWLLERA